MAPAWSMLTVFALALLGGKLLNLSNPLAITVLSRLIILLCFGIGLVLTWRQQTPYRLTRHNAALPSPAALRLKTKAIRLALATLLLFSLVMGRVFPQWPAAIFNLEFLILLPLLLWATPHYVRRAEQHMSTGEDDYYRLGAVLSGQRRWNWAEHRALLLAWAVKLFFIPLMYSWLVQEVEHMLTFNWRLHPGNWVVGLFGFGLSADLLIASAGYFFASRLLGNEVRSTDSSWSGWLICLLCYPPLLSIFHLVKQQVDEVIWSDWLQPGDPLYWIWAALITTSWVVYWLSTVSFGLRFSNLSWRGLIDSGPYRFTRHPAYLSKNIYWWLHTVPFIGIASSHELLRNLLGLCFVSGVYYLRAYTEERHLLRFPEYAAYHERIEREGLLAIIRRILRRACP